MATKLEQEHIDFLTNAFTLEEWAGETLKRRTILFHRNFPDKRIAVTSLRRLYLKNEVKRKKVRQEKYMPANTRISFQRNCQKLLETMQRMREENVKIVYLDEINFTKRSISLREWSGKNSNLAIDQKDIMVGYRSVIASITEQEGVGLRQVYSQAITGKDFADYLLKLRARYPRRKLAVFMDQLSVHK
jgi:hypothetical protein